MAKSKRTSLVLLIFAAFTAGCHNTGSTEVPAYTRVTLPLRSPEQPFKPDRVAIVEQLGCEKECWTSHAPPILQGDPSTPPMPWLGPTTIVRYAIHTRVPPYSPTMSDSIGRAMILFSPMVIFYPVLLFPDAMQNLRHAFHAIESAEDVYVLYVGDGETAEAIASARVGRGFAVAGYSPAEFFKLLYWTPFSGSDETRGTVPNFDSAQLRFPPNLAIRPVREVAPTSRSTR